MDMDREMMIKRMRMMSGMAGSGMNIPPGMPAGMAAGMPAGIANMTPMQKFQMGLQHMVQVIPNVLLSVRENKNSITLFFTLSF